MTEQLNSDQIETVANRIYTALNNRAWGLGTWSYQMIVYQITLEPTISKPAALTETILFEISGADRKFTDDDKRAVYSVLIRTHQ